MASKEELLSSINPDMGLTRDFFKQIYGFELSYLGFSNEAIERLKAVGCSYARQYYEDWTADYEKQQKVVLKLVAEWYRRQCEKQWENRLRGGELQRTLQNDLQLMSDSDLITLLENLIGVT